MDRSPPNSTLPASEKALIQEFIQALADEVEALRRGGGGSTLTVFDGQFVRQDGPLFIYAFSTESILAVMDEAPAEVEVNGQKVKGQIVSVQGTEIAIGIERNFGPVIQEARLITSLWYLLEALKKRFEEILSGERVLNTELAQKLFSGIAGTAVVSREPLDLPATRKPPNDDQKEALLKALGSEVSFIWGPPGTGKTKTIGFLVAALLSRGFRVLVVSHTNVATDKAIQSAAELLKPSSLYQQGKLIRFGTIKDEELPKEFPMVTIEGAAETLGRHLQENLDKLNVQLTQLKDTLSPLQETSTLLLRVGNSRRQLEAVQVNFTKVQQDLISAQAHQEQLVNQVLDCQDLLARARTAGALKRLFLRLDPTRIQAQLGQLQSQLSVVDSYFCDNFDRWTSLLKPPSDATDIENSSLYTEKSFFDRAVAWEGSLNILSQREGRSTEHMRRIGDWKKPAEKTCAELIAIHSLGSDAEVAPGVRRPIQIDRVCAVCGAPMVLRRGQSGVFAGCSRYLQCNGQPDTIRRGDRILTDAFCPGKDGHPCGQRMVVRIGRHGVFLSCPDPDCRKTQNIP